MSVVLCINSTMKYVERNLLEPHLIDSGIAIQILKYVTNNNNNSNTSNTELTNEPQQ